MVPTIRAFSPRASRPVSVSGRLADSAIGKGGILARRQRQGLRRITEVGSLKEKDAAWAIAKPLRDLWLGRMSGHRRHSRLDLRCRRRRAEV
jgi:hypothetical protein